MTTESAGDQPLSEAETIAAEFISVRTFVIYNQAALFTALAARGAIDAEQVCAMKRMLASGFRQTAAAGKSGRVPALGHAKTADMLDELEAVIRNMATIPAGAGRA
jgi:hypothetical protein